MRRKPKVFKRQGVWMTRIYVNDSDYMVGTYQTWEEALHDALTF